MLAVFLQIFAAVFVSVVCVSLMRLFGRDSVASDAWFTLVTDTAKRGNLQLLP